jgi:hypothetical protein
MWKTFPIAQHGWIGDKDGKTSFLNLLLIIACRFGMHSLVLLGLTMM